MNGVAAGFKGRDGGEVLEALRRDCAVEFCIDRLIKGFRKEADGLGISNDTVL
jgi:hypothetical protein